MSINLSPIPERQPYTNVWEMTPEQIEYVEHEMQPGVLVNSGYLPQGKALVEKCNADRDFLEKQKISIDSIYRKLEHLLIRTETIRNKLEARNASVGSVTLDGQWRISWDQQYKEECCPFSTADRCGEYEGGSTEYYLENLGSKETMYFSDTSMHLLKEHHFFYNPYEEGMGLSPQYAIQILRIQNTDKGTKRQPSKKARIQQLRKDLLDNGISLRVTV